MPISNHSWIQSLQKTIHTASLLCPSNHLQTLLDRDLAHQMICTHTGISNPALATNITFSVNPTLLLLLCFFITFFFFFPSTFSTALQTATTTTTKDEQRRTNGKTLFHTIYWFSCLPWLTVTFYIIHLSFNFRFATTMTTTITMTTTLMTTPPLSYSAHKGCFKIFLM
jgi:hypothetical protein